MALYPLNKFSYFITASHISIISIIKGIFLLRKIEMDFKGIIFFLWSDLLFDNAYRLEDPFPNTFLSNLFGFTLTFLKIILFKPVTVLFILIKEPILKYKLQSFI